MLNKWVSFLKKRNYTGRKNLNSKMKKNKRAQIGETMTWIVATIIIVVLLIFFVYASSLLGKAKKIISTKDSVLPGGYSRTNDLVLEKSVFTYFLVSDDKKEIIYNKLKAEKNSYVDLDEKIKKMRLILND